MSSTRGRGQAGFTLVELLVVLLLVSIVMAISVSAGRNYWFRRSLVAAQGDAAFALRELQQSSVAESNPLVFGARFQPGSEGFTMYRYNPLAGGGCTQIGDRGFDAGVEVSSASFERYRVGGGSSGPFVSSLCGGGEPSEYVFFFARGSATDGSVVLEQDRVGDPNQRRVQVIGLTGRVETVEL